MNAHESKASESDRRLAIKEAQLGRLTGYLPHLMLVVSTVVSVLSDPGSIAAGLATAGLAALTAMYIWGWRSLPSAWTDRQAMRNLYFVGLLVFTAFLVSRNPWFGFFAWCNYLAVVDLLRGRAQFAGVIAAAFLHVSTFLGGIPGVVRLDAGGYLFLFILIAVASTLVIVLTRYQEVSDARTENRKRVIAELAEANAKLEAVIKENEGLHAQLLTQAREAGMLDERQRMAREIHDTIAQGLTGIVTQVQAAKNVADRPEDWRQHLDNAARLARDSLSEARRSVQAMAPEVLETAHLPDAITDVARQWSKTSGVPVEVTTTGTAQTMHPEVEVTLLRTAQEALANVAKHARATRVGLTLSYMTDVVTLDVLDDGVGFEVNGARPNGDGGDGRDGGDGQGTLAGGFGLKAMRQRVDRLAGALTIESEPGGGTVVSASLPAVPQAVPTQEVPTQEPELEPDEGPRQEPQPGPPFRTQEAVDA